MGDAYSSLDAIQQVRKRHTSVFHTNPLPGALNQQRVMKKYFAITLFMLPLITASAQESYFYF